jgi:hypothetical protein
MAWSPDGRELVATDVTLRRLLRYSLDGRLLSTVEKPAFVRGDFKPSQVHATPEGFLVRNSAYDWIWFDRHFNPLRSVGPSLPKFAVIAEALFGDQQLVGFGTFRKDDGSWGLGILRVGLRPSLGLSKVVEEISTGSKGGDLSSFLSSLVATASGTPYALRFDEPSYILNAENGRRLKAFPKGFDHIPSLPKNNGEDSTLPRARVIDASTIPVALYGRGASLYLLTRQAGPQGKTLWRLHRIDPGKDAVLSSVTIPSSAAELELAPGPDSWAILEESWRPTGSLHSDVLLLIPAAVIDHGGTLPPCG